MNSEQQARELLAAECAGDEIALSHLVGDMVPIKNALNAIMAALTQPKPAGDVGREVASALRAAYSERTTSQPEAEGVEVYIKPTTIALMTQAAHAGVLVSGEVFNQPSAETVRLYTATRQQQEAGRVDEDRVKKLREVNAAWSEAIGLTKMCLMQGDTAGAMAALNKASNEADEIFGAALNPGSLGGGHG